MGTSGSTCTLITASTALNTLTASCNIDGRTEMLATWHALHQVKAKETILEQREYSTIRCMVCC